MPESWFSEAMFDDDQEAENEVLHTQTLCHHASLLAGLRDQRLASFSSELMMMENAKFGLARTTKIIN